MKALFDTKWRNYLPPAILPARRFGRVIRDYDQVWPKGITDTFPNGVTHVSRPTRNGNSANVDKDINGQRILPERGTGLPATARSKGGIVVALNRERQEFLHQTNCDLAGLPYDNSYAMGSFATATRNNSYAFDTHQDYHDYINNLNPEAEDIRNIAMLTGDALCEIMGEQRVDQEDCYVIKAINVLTDDLWKYNFKDHPELSNQPQNSRRERIIINGVWRNQYREDLVNFFHMYNGKFRMWYFSPTGFLYIQKYRVKLL